MRICLICEYFYPDRGGGTPMVVSQLSRHLKDAHPGLQIDVIASKHLYRGDEKNLARRENWNGVHITRLNTPKSNRPSTALRLAAGLMFSLATLRHLLLRRGPRYDLIFIITNPPTVPIAAQVFGRLRRVPYVYMVHDLYPDLATALDILKPESKIARMFHRLQKSWLHGAAEIVVIGRCMKEYLAQTYDVPREKIEVITNWSDEKRITPLDKNTNFRRANNLQNFVVLYAGNFGQYQNFDNILDAAKILRDEKSAITFVFVGDGARKPDIAARIENEKISNAKMFPFVGDDEFADLLASADVSMVTLEPGAEGLGVPSKFYNILASGRPTVAIVAANSEVAQTVQENCCGVAVPQGDAKALAQTISQLADEPQKLEEMGQNARRAFEENYTLNRIGARFYELFEKIAGQKTKR